ncbi:sensor histidine kinase [Amycolatopsis australiensis]|uniref:Two-component system, NarL family, sensor histidine kinase DesK n=1 Tax=Amycolatopsis australiensis TaxID=546364 RepID=A0A1K1RK28_9PSEU|nr:histidine kinase [Amycolatopsis australiensis]SFW72196.1 two-component system, NarL family, sensor histidine kinase DesK [Amycolatopsis australiensis]
MAFPVRLRMRGAKPAEEDAGGPGFHALVAGAPVAAATAVALTALLPVLAERPSWLPRLLALVCAAALAGVHLAAFARGRVRRPGRALAAQALLGFGPLLPLGASWSAAGGFLAGGLLLAVRPSRALPAAGLVCLVAGLVPPGSADAGYVGVVSAGIAALALFGAGAAARLAAEREEERRELKRRAIAEERKRFSRDVHDLLGLSLSAITLKGELINRLVMGQPGRAKEELAELLTMSRRALADVRTVAAGYRELSLDDECRAAAAVLSAAGTRVTLARSGTADLPLDVATALAAVLREGVTNVVRHSTASWCALSVSKEDGTAWLEIVNDGAGGPADTDPCAGAGLRNLVDRVESLGGTLATETGTDGTHRLLAAVPVGHGRVRRHRAPDELSA